MLARLIYRAPADAAHQLSVRLLLAIWAIAVLYLTTRHAMWRDEVRALSFALQGENVREMLQGLRGEGHPALWYLFLRTVSSLAPASMTLQISAFAIALLSALLLAMRSPFSRLVIGLILFSSFGLFEYAVMSRNYGISMLLMFTFAAAYPRFRSNGWVPGCILFLLINCNVHSVPVAAALLAFWFMEIAVGEDPWNWRSWKYFVTNSLLALAGVVVCVATVFPSFNDAAQPAMTSGIPFIPLAIAFVLPGTAMCAVVLPDCWIVPGFPARMALGAFTTVLLLGSVVGLAKRPAALISACLGLWAFVLLFTVVYPGGYRHVALWIALLVTLYWLAGQPTVSAPTTTWFPAWCQNLMERCEPVGKWFFVALLAIQVASGVPTLAALVFKGLPESRSKDLGALISSDPTLREAVIIADPDFLVEPVPYYLPNRTYFIREQRFAGILRFTKTARLDLSITDILDDAAKLKQSTGKPVIILLSERLDPTALPHVVKSGYNWTTRFDPKSVSAFLARTRLINSFGPTSRSDETFDVYLLER